MSSPAAADTRLLDHAQFLHEVPDESLTEILPLAKKIATAIGCPNYNILQNNGHLARKWNVLNFTDFLNGADLLT